MTNRGSGNKGIVVLDDHSPISVEQQFTSAADATIRGGAYAANNYGADATMTTKLSFRRFHARSLSQIRSERVCGKQNRALQR